MWQFIRIKDDFYILLTSSGDLISNDISIGLNIPFSKAEEIKICQCRL